MVEWCPKCKAMITPGLERCPSCGKRLRKNSEGMAVQDVFWLSAYIIGIAMIPILIAIAIGVACSFLGR